MSSAASSIGLGLQDVEAAERLLRLEERAVGDEHPSPSNRTVRPASGGASASPTTLRAALCEVSTERDVLVDDRPALVIGHGRFGGGIAVEQEQELHGADLPCGI